MCLFDLGCDLDTGDVIECAFAFGLRFDIDRAHVEPIASALLVASSSISQCCRPSVIAGPRCATCCRYEAGKETDQEGFQRWQTRANDAGVGLDSRPGCSSHVVIGWVIRVGDFRKCRQTKNTGETDANTRLVRRCTSKRTGSETYIPPTTNTSMIASFWRVGN